MKATTTFQTPAPFIRYATELKKDIAILEKVILPAPIMWTIDWKWLTTIEPGKKRNKWGAFDFYQNVAANKKLPSVYYVTFEKSSGKEIHDHYLYHKSISSGARLNRGIAGKSYLNISHVPTNFFETSCLYAGSVKKDMQIRLLQHLGCTGSGRTGALYLLKVLEGMKIPPVVKFHIHILPIEWINITEHIECIVQDELKPLIGKRAFKPLTLYKS